MNKQIPVRKGIAKSVEKHLNVYLKPYNEKQELNYFESFVGSSEQILKRSLEIIHGLNIVLAKGDFSVKIENIGLNQVLYLDSENLFDSEFNIIGKIEEFLQI